MGFKYADGFLISLDYRGQRNLRVNGVVIPASWWITKERQEKLRVLGAQPPEPIQGHVILDTAQPHIAIDEQIAQELKLKPTGKTKEVYGPSQAESVNYYLAQLMLPVVPVGQENTINSKFALGIPVEAWAIPTLQLSHTGYKDEGGTTLKIIGILGRIFLQFTTFTYNGLTGKVEIHIDYSAMFPKKD